VANGISSQVVVGYVNLLAAGVSSGPAKAQALTWVPTNDQTQAGTIIDAIAAASATEAALSWDQRVLQGYFINGPFMTYAHI
jgi:hypothetical protein